MYNVCIGELDVKARLASATGAENLVTLESDSKCNIKQSRSKTWIEATDTGLIVAEEERIKITKDANISLLLAAGSLIPKIGFEGVLTDYNRISGSVTVRFRVSIPNEYITGTRTLPKSPAASLLFLHLKPYTSDGSLGFSEFERLQSATPAARTPSQQQRHQDNGATDNAFTLRNLLLSLPTKATDPDPPALLKDTTNSQSTEVSLPDLGQNLISRILSFIDDPATVQSLAATCRHFRSVAADLAPGLMLTLFPHQRAAVRWMLQREHKTSSSVHNYSPSSPIDLTTIANTTSSNNNDASAIPHPTIRAFPSQCGNHTLYCCTAIGSISTTPPPPSHDCNGGLLCDEPGLGKTITSLALILRTKGTVPQPPSAAEGVLEVKWLTTPDGKKLGMYYLDAERVESASESDYRRRHQAQNTSNAPVTRIRHRSAGVPLFRYTDSFDEGEQQQQHQDDQTPLADDANMPTVCNTTITDKSKSTQSPSNVPKPLPQPSRCCHHESSSLTDSPPLTTTHSPTLEDSNGGDTQQEKRRKDENVVYPATALSFEDVDNTDEDAEMNDKHRSKRRRGVKEDEDNEDISYDEYSDDDTEMSSEDNQLWVQCFLCNKWRLLPPGAVVNFNDDWACAMHPLEGWRTCSIRGDVEGDDTHLTDATGWVSTINGDSSGCKPHNVTFFRELLYKHEGVRYRWCQHEWIRFRALEYRGIDSEHVIPALDWLVRQTPDQLLSSGGGRISSIDGVPGGYGSFFLDLGLEPVASKKGNKNRDVANLSYMRNASHSMQTLNKNDYMWWQQPPSHTYLRIDTEALKSAIQQGPIPPHHRIFLSSATLVVLPTELIPHWTDQIIRHTAPGALRVAVYDSKNSKLTSSGQLAWEIDIVLTTFSTLSSQWNAKDPLNCSPLMQIHWQRIILDEGHLVGSLNVTNKLQMAANLRAGSRWCMTGTPTPDSGGSLQADYLQPLLSFLIDEPLGSQLSTWKQAIGEPMSLKKEEGRYRALELLHRCMIRASKSDLRNFPRLHKTVTVLQTSPVHAESFNRFVDLIRFNLLTSDWYDMNHEESLLNGKNASRANQTWNNLRLGCNVTGNITLHVNASDRLEVLEMLAEENGWQPFLSGDDVDDDEGLPPTVPTSPTASSNNNDDINNSFAIVNNNNDTSTTNTTGLDLLTSLTSNIPEAAAIDAAMRIGGTCSTCNTTHRVLIITPCAHLLCVDCASTSKTSCVACSKPYTMQKKEDPSRKQHNKNPLWDVPQGLVELQPAYVQLGATGEGEGTWQAEWMDSVETTKCEYLLHRLKDLGAIQSPTTKGGNGFNVNNAAKPPKVIVFTQFWNHGLVLESYLKKNSVPLALYHKQLNQRDKSTELRRFIHASNYDCNVLLMDESGALGLDLSCVSHVFLMEPVENVALEEQIISRAWRMGATRDVTVETLAMKGTPEELMVERRKIKTSSSGGGGHNEKRAMQLAERNEFFLALTPLK